MQLAKGLLNKAKDIAAQTAQELQQRAQESLTRTWEQQQQRARAQQAPHVQGTQLQVSTTAQSPEARAARFRQELLASPINLVSLRRLAYDGVPDLYNLRALVWKLLLNYLPSDPSQWSDVLDRRRKQYATFCEDLIVDPKKISKSISASNLLALSAPTTTAAGTEAQQQQLQQQQQQQQQQRNAQAPTPAGPSCFGDANSSSQQVDPLLSGPGTTSTSTRNNDNAQSGPSTSTASTAPAPPAAGGAGGLLQQGLTASSTGTAALPPEQQQQQQRHPLDPVTDPVIEPEPVADHPLCLSQTSVWNTYFQDNEIMIQVDRDVMRTHPDMAFFTGDSHDAELHREELKRALFMYAKLNPGLRYIQGMNELIAPLYYLFKHDPDPQARQCAEADAFWCFLELISEFRDHFCQQLDNEQTGIRATIRRLMAYLQHFDAPLWRHMEITHKVDPQFYAFRWITLLLSQEFSFPDVLRIWDTILSDPHGRLDCLLRVCTAMILNIADTLRAGDFTIILKTLQRYPPVDVGKLLAMAARMPAVKEVLGAAPGTAG